MAAEILPATDCYVYILYREDGTTPFYVGKGKGKRILAHEKEAMREKQWYSHKDKIIRKMVLSGIDVPKRKVRDGITSEEACNLEIQLIASIGRIHEGGTLVNVTAGGEGNLSPTPEHRAKLRASHLGRKASEATKERLSAARKGIPPSRKAIEAAADAKRGVPKSEETKEKISATLFGRKNGAPSEETKQKISAALTGKKRPRQSPETQAKRSESLKASWASMSDEDKAKRGMIGKKHSLETRLKMAESRRSVVLRKQEEKNVQHRSN